MDQISLTVPMTYTALTRASEMLRGLVEDLAQEARITTGAKFSKNAEPTAATTTEPTAATTTEPTAATIFKNPADNATPAPAGVTLANGLPWDERIHGAGKKTLAKAPHGWKYKRGVSDEMIATVEAELRAVMAIPPAGTVAAVQPTPINTPVAVDPNVTQSPVPVADSTTVTPATSASAITTLPALMQAATKAGKTPADMLAAVTKQGLASVALLGARPDLIPAVAADLGV